MSGVIFQRDDPKSPEWRAALRRFMSRGLLGEDVEVEVIKGLHHEGWRAGVESVRRRRPPPGCLEERVGVERRAWEHGAVAGRQAARAYIEENDKRPQDLR